MPKAGWLRGLGTPWLQPVCPHPHFWTSFSFISCVGALEAAGAQDIPAGAPPESGAALLRGRLTRAGLEAAVHGGLSHGTKKRLFGCLSHSAKKRQPAARRCPGDVPVMSQRCPGDVPATKSIGAGSAAPPQSQSPAPPPRQQLPGGFLCYFFNSGSPQDAFCNLLVELSSRE